MPSCLCAVTIASLWRFAEIAAPLTDLLKDGGLRPTTDAGVLDAVAKLKEALISRPVLAYKTDGSTHLGCTGLSLVWNLKTFFCDEQPIKRELKGKPDLKPAM